MADKSGYLYKNGDKLLIKTIADNVIVKDVKANFVNTNLESILDELKQSIKANDTSNLVVKETGKGLSTNDFTNDLKTKLNSIEMNANNYIHPATHEASMIITDEDHQFVTQAQIDSFSNVNLDEVDNKIAQGDLDTLDASKEYTDNTKTALIDDAPASCNTFNKVNTLISGIKSDIESIQLPKLLNIQNLDDTKNEDLNVSDIGYRYGTVETKYYKCIDETATTFETKFEEVDSIPEDSSSYEYDNKTSAIKDTNILIDEYAFITYYSNMEYYICIDNLPEKNKDCFVKLIKQSDINNILSSYVKSDDLTAILSDYSKTTDVENTITDYVKKEEFSSYIVQISQAEYDALTDIDPNKVYIIKD